MFHRAASSHILVEAVQKCASSKGLHSKLGEKYKRLLKSIRAGQPVIMGVNWPASCWSYWACFTCAFLEKVLHVRLADNFVSLCRWLVVFGQF